MKNIDLSHWQVIKHITVGQAGLLIAGIDPYNVGGASKADVARGQAFGVAIAQAAERADDYARQLLDNQRDDDVFLTPDIWEVSGFFEDFLPSIEMRRSVGDVIADPDRVALLAPTDPQFTESVIAHELKRWMNENDIVSQFAFRDDQWIVVRDYRGVPEDQPVPGPLLVIDDDQGESAESTYTFRHKTRLLSELEAAINQLWTLYDPEDPSTAPTNEQVVEFLLGRNVSRRLAEAMATILRADGLPSGPRK